MDTPPELAASPIFKPVGIEALAAQFKVPRQLVVSGGSLECPVEIIQLSRHQAEMVNRVLKRQPVLTKPGGDGVVGIDLDSPEAVANRMRYEARADALVLLIGWVAMKERFPDLVPDQVAENDKTLDQIADYLLRSFPAEFILSMRKAIEGEKFDVEGLARSF